MAMSSGDTESPDYTQETFKKTFEPINYTKKIALMDETFSLSKLASSIFRFFVIMPCIFLRFLSDS
jgi:hypothetical protein